MPPTPLPSSDSERALTATAIHRIADFIDSLDEHEECKLVASLDPYCMGNESRDAWMYAALVLADQSTATTADMRLWANRISRGIQGEFRF